MNEAGPKTVDKHPVAYTNVTEDDWVMAERLDDTPSPWRWLGSTRRLQREAYGHDWSVVGTDVATVTESLKDNLFAMVVELMGETPRDFHWKSWSNDPPWLNRAKVLQELVDAQHFMANMLVALGVTDEEWETAYRAKQAENLRRQEDGYSVRRS